MKAALRFLFIAGAMALLAGCGTHQQAVKPDSSGYLPTGGNGTDERAHTLIAEHVDLQQFKPLALVTASDFTLQQIRYLGFFDQVLSLKDLQQLIVEHNLQDKVPSINDRIGVNNAARNYHTFLWIHYDGGNRDGKSYIKLVVTDPLTLKDIFVAEQQTRTQAQILTGYTDQNTWYPLFNSFIDWLKMNRVH